MKTSGQDPLESNFPRLSDTEDGQARPYRDVHPWFIPGIRVTQPTLAAPVETLWLLEAQE